MDSIDFDGLNDAIRKVEAALLDLNIGVGGEVDMEDGWVLGFGKIDGVWCLYVDHEDAPRRKPLLDASIQDRVEASKKLTALRGVLHNNYKEAVAAVKAATDAYQTFARDVQES